MKHPASKSPAKRVRDFVMIQVLDPRHREIWTSAASAEGLTLTAWCRKTLIAAATREERRSK